MRLKSSEFTYYINCYQVNVSYHQPLLILYPYESCIPANVTQTLVCIVNNGNVYKILFLFVYLRSCESLNLYWLIFLNLSGNPDRVCLSIKGSHDQISYARNRTEVWTNQREEGGEGGRGQPECFHGDWLSAMPLRGQRSLTRRSICHAASGGSQSRKRCQEKRDQSEERMETVSGPQVRAERRWGQVFHDLFPDILNVGWESCEAVYPSWASVGNLKW